MKEKLEEMSAFFTARVEGYDQHMLEEVEGCREGYQRLAQALPEKTRRLLDLGCGTGLELEPVFCRFPDAEVTGVDLTAAMLERCRKKFEGKALRLIQGDYLRLDFGENLYHGIISFQSLHHFTHEEKLGLYHRLYQALSSGGVFVQCDYMVETQEEETDCRREYERLIQEQGEGGMFHYDTPFSIEHESQVLREAGFEKVERLWRQGNTTLVIGEKAP